MGAGAVRDAFTAGKHWKQAQPTPGSSNALRLTRVGYQARTAALQASVSQAVTGRRIDVEPVISYAEQGASAPRERLEAAAIRIDGKVYRGADHREALQAAAREMGEAKVDAIDLNTLDDGFITSAGRYVDRTEARIIRDRAGQTIGTPPGPPTSIAAQDIDYARGGASPLVRARFGEEMRAPGAEQFGVSLERQADEMMEIASTLEVNSPQWHELREQAQRLREGETRPEAPRGEPTINDLVRPDQLTAQAKASFLPENARMYDGELVRIKDEAIKAAPKDEDFPEISLAEEMEALDAEMENITAEVTAIEAKRAAKTKPRLKPDKLVDPELRMPMRPVVAMLKRGGGVKPNSPLAQELRNMGLTARKAPGLFRQGGRSAADTFIVSENPEFHRLGRTGDDYIPEEAVIEAIRDEMFGAPWRSPAQEEDIAAFRQALDKLEGTAREEGAMPGEGAPAITGEEGETMFGELLREHQEAFDAMLAEGDQMADDAAAYGRAAEAYAVCAMNRGA